MPKTARKASKPKAQASPAKAGKRKPYGFRTVELGVVPELLDAAQALAVGAKEVWNVCAYLIRHVHMAHEWDKASKRHLRVDMSKWEKEKRRACEAALAEADALAKELNEERAAKAKAGDGGKAAKPLPRLGPSVAGLDKLLTDATFMERFAKAHPDGLRAGWQPAFLRLPPRVARDAAGLACDALKGRRQAMISWTPGDPLPKLPGYRREAASFSFEWSERPQLADLSDLELHVDIERTVLLSTEAKRVWRSFDIHGHVEKCLAARYEDFPEWMLRPPTIEDVTMLRFVPAFQGGRPVHRLQAVISLPAQPFPGGSFLGELSDLFQRKFKRVAIADAAAEALGAGDGMGIDWDSEATPRIDPGKFDQGMHFGKAVKAVAMDAWLREILACQSWRRAGHSSSDKAYTWVSRRYTACFVDPGVNNLTAIGFANGLPGTILSGRNFERKLGRMDKKIDVLASEALGPRGRELQSKRDKLQNERAAAEAPRVVDPELFALAPGDLRLSKAEAKELRSWFALAAKTPKLQSLRRERKEFIRGQPHQLAAEIVREATKANAAFIVLGKNPGWKSGSDLGAEQNRRLYSFPHSLAWKLVHEKAWVQGIAVVETEESHTSRTSFVHGDPMEVHPAQAAKKKSKAFKASAKAKAPRAFLRNPKSSPQGIEAMKASFQARVEGELAKQETSNQQPKTAEPKASGARGRQGKDRHRFSFAREAPLRPPRLLPGLKTQGKPMPGPPSKTHAERRAIRLSRARGTPRKWSGDRVVDGKELGGMHADLNAAYNIGRKACPLFSFHHGLSLAIRVREFMWTEDAKGWRPIHMGRRSTREPKAKPSPAAA